MKYYSAKFKYLCARAGLEVRDLRGDEPQDLGREKTETVTRSRRAMKTRKRAREKEAQLAPLQELW